MTIRILYNCNPIISRAIQKKLHADARTSGRIVMINYHRRIGIIYRTEWRCAYECPNGEHSGTKILSLFNIVTNNHDDGPDTAIHK